MKDIFFRRNQSNLANLDALRGMAITSVLVSHFYPRDALFAESINLSTANAGVILFFFLSGFLMDRTYGGDPRLFAYLIRRSFRIMPMYLVSIILIFILASDIDGTIGGHHWTFSDMASNALFVTGLTHVTRMSGVYWTLYIEIMFYALVPLLFALGKRASYCAPFLLVVAFAGMWLAGLQFSKAPFYLVYCLTGWQFGVWYRGELSGRFLLVLVGTVVVGSSALPIVSPFLGIAPAVCSLLLYAALRYRFRMRIFETFGDVSYSWYLLHAIFGYAARNFAMSLGCPEWGSALIGIGLTFVLSVLTFIVVERPVINLGKRIIRWRYSASDKTPQAVGAPYHD